jgi:hypothetical protein
MFRRLGQCHSSAVDECHVGLPRRGRIHWFSKYDDTRRQRNTS